MEDKGLKEMTNVSSFVNESFHRDTNNIPDYVCCVVTEATWTWFGCILLIVVSFGVGTLKYCRSILRSSRYRRANVSLSISAVQVDQKFALDAIRTEPIDVADFPKYNRMRQRHPELDNIELARITKAAKAAKTAIRTVGYDDLQASLIDTSLETKRVKEDDKENNKCDGVWWVSGSPMSELSSVALWSLIWTEKLNVIVMVTQLFEHTREMCHQYWPLVATDHYGDFRVTLVEEEMNAHFQVRLLELEKRGRTKSSKRRVCQYHFTEWPLNQTPSPNLLLQFRRRLLEDVLGQIDQPRVLLHCHDGGERSGVFLAIDKCLRGAERDQQVDVHGVVEALLIQRPRLLTKVEHLRFIFDVVEDHLVCGHTFVAADSFLRSMQSKGESGFLREHALLKSLVPRFTIGDCAAGHRAENRAKNRHVLIVPPDAKRPYLRSFRGNDCTDYINAVFVDSYRSTNEFICSEWPQSGTITDFLALINDHQVKSVVVLNKPRRTSRFPVFWPNGENSLKMRMKSQIFKLTLTNQTDNRLTNDKGIVCYDLMLGRQQLSAKAYKNNHTSIIHPILKTLIVLGKSSRVGALRELVSSSLSLGTGSRFRLFQMLSWPDSQSVPNSTMAMVKLLEAVESWRESSSGDTKRGHVLVLSTDGYSRVGVFCVAAMCMEQLRRRGEVDVFQAVKTVQQNRPQLISSVDEYKFCYDTMLHLVLAMQQTQ